MNSVDGHSSMLLCVRLIDVAHCVSGERVASHTHTHTQEPRQASFISLASSVVSFVVVRRKLRQVEEAFVALQSERVANTERSATFTTYQASN